MPRNVNLEELHSPALLHFDLFLELKDLIMKSSSFNEEWRDEASCVKMGPYADRLFFPWESIRVRGHMSTEAKEELQGKIKTAIDICLECPSRLPCLTWSLIYREPEGIWGGHTPPWRQNFRRKLLRQARRMKGAYARDWMTINEYKERTVNGN